MDDSPSGALGARPLWEDLGEAGEFFEVIDGFAVLGRLGEGGMGEVFHARQLSTGREVAVKLLREGVSVARFRQEIAALARLAHPGLVPILHAGEHRGRPYYTMELVAGPNLAQRAQAQPFGPREAAAVIAAVARAIHHAHERGILHRDLKPQNVLLGADGRARVTDFGLARSLGPDAASLTLTGAQLGTPAYMAPEQVAGDRDRECAATDVYGLGAMLYHLLTGVPPFRADSVERVFRMVLEMDPPSPRLLQATLDADLEIIGLACLEKEPGRRYASALELAEELDRWLAGEPIRRRAPTQFERLAKWCRRKPTVAALTLATLLAVVLGFAGVLWQWNRTQQANVQLQRAVGELSLFKADTLFEQGDTTRALSELAVSLRRQPNSDLIAMRLWAALTRRNFLLPIHELGPAAGVVDAVFWSPDGSRLVGLSFAQTNQAREMRLWDVSTGRLVAGPQFLSGTEGEAGFSQDGRWFLTALSGDLQVWNATNLTPFGEPIVRSAPSVAAAWHPDSRRLLTVAGTNEAMLLELGTRQRQRVFSHETTILSVAVSPDGQWVGTGDAQGTVSVWETDTGRKVSGPFPHSGAVIGLAFSTNRLRLAVTAARGASVSVILRELPGGRSLSTNAEVRHADFTQDGARLFAHSEAVAALTESSNGASLGRWSGHGGFVPQALSRDGRRFVAIRDFADLRLLDATGTNSASEAVHHSWALTATELSPSGDRVAVCADTPSVVVWDARPGGGLEPLALNPGGSRVAFSGDGRRLAVGGANRLQIYETASWQAVGPALTHTGTVKVLRFSGRDSFLLTGTDQGDVRLWDGKATNLIARLPFVAERPTAAAFSPDETVLATLTVQASLQFWRTRDGTPLTAAIDVQAGLPPGFGKNGFDVQFNSDGTRVIVCAYNGFATVWAAGTTNRLLALDHDLSPVAQVRHSRDGRYLATASFDSAARIWDAATGQPLSPKLRHDASVFTVDFSPDGRRLLTAGEDDIARVWSVPGGELLATARGHTGDIVDARFSPEGRRFATISLDATARIWDSGTVLPLDETVTGLTAGGARLAWSLDGSHLVVTSQAGQAYVLATPTLPTPVPSWLPELAEALAGQTQDHSPGPVLLRLRDRLMAQPGEDFYARWARWFFSDRATRKPFP